MIKTFLSSDTSLLQEFDLAREELIREFPDKLVSNYTLENFNYNEQTAFSIGYKNNSPFLFSTIFRRQWWPEGAYRILNRTWKLERQDHISRGIDPIFRYMVEDQIDWLKSNTNYKAAFISREKNSRNTLFNVMDELNIGKYKFDFYDDRVWVCEGSEEYCLQNILYTGDMKVFLKWKPLNA